MSEWRSMNCAPKNGHSILLMTNERILQASWCTVRQEWSEEKEWTKAELSRPSPKINAIAWAELPKEIK